MDWSLICRKAKADIEKEGEARNVPFNLAHLADPSQAAIPDDVLEISKVVKSGKFYFWDTIADCPKAPKIWPRGRNVPIVTYNNDIKSGGPWQHYGHCSVVAGFFWAFGQALHNPTWRDKVAAFETLCVNALADYKLVQNPAEVHILAFNAVEENEESRENDGFTGARKALLVTFGVKHVMKEKKGGKLKYEDVSAWLKAHIKFHDEKAVPSAHVCRDLHSLGTDFIKNRRAFAAYQEAETLWGRSTMFDEYSKLVILVQKSRSAEDLAFVCEWLLAVMKKTAPPPQVPENYTQVKLKDVGGPLCLAQAAKDAVTCLLKQNTPPTWAPFAELLGQLSQPSRFLDLFPPGGKTPDSTVQLLAACPSSLKQAANILKGIFEGSNATPWKEKIRGYLNKTRVWNIPNEKLIEMFEVFDEDWTSFQDACRTESGKEPTKTKIASETTGNQEGKGDEVADNTTAANQEATQKVNNRQEVMVLAKKRAADVWTDPGIVILTPDRWERASLESLMKTQIILADQGAFCAFFFSASDREARCHPSQNKCLREAPLSKARLLNFSQAVNGIMQECRDAVVISVGRVPGNEKIVEAVVVEMKWEHKIIDAVTERNDYDKFIKSGSPSKKRRTLRGLATCKYKVQFWICWKPAKDGGRSTLPIKAGFRVHVDKGSPVAADIMLDVPHVSLAEIYTVTKDKQKKALGHCGMETDIEAKESKDKDSTQPN